MKTPARTALAALAAAVLVAACAGSSGKPWTPPPVVTPGPETPAPVTAAPATPAPVTPAPVTPAPETPAPTGAAPTAGASMVPGEARVIELEETAALEIKLGGTKVTDIPVTPGETIRFVITNTAGYPHNFWIGTDEQLSAGQTAGLPGIPDFSSGTQEFEWTVPADITGLKYGCTLPGHYVLMQGTFSPAQ